MTAVECSLPNCGQTAVLQWARLGRPDEAAGQIQVTQAAAEWNDEYQRATIRSSITQLEAMREHVKPDMQGHLDTQIQREQARLAAVRDTVISPTDNTVHVAVFGCGTHAVSVDQATEIHESECLSAGPCLCLTSPRAVVAALTVPA